MPRKEIAVVNRKGGSGKTTTLFNVAGALLERGYSILAIDLDPQASLSRSLQVSPGSLTLSGVLLAPSERFREIIQTTWILGLDVVPADPDLASLDLQLAETAGRESHLRRCLSRYLPAGYDFILLDCPPSLGMLTVNALVAASHVLVPVDGGSYGMEALNDTLDAIQSVRRGLRYDLSMMGIVLNNVNLRTSYDQAADESLRERFGPLMFRTVIPNSIRVDEASQFSRPLVYYDGSAHVAAAYRRLVDEIIERGSNHGQQARLQSGPGAYPFQTASR